MRDTSRLVWEVDILCTFTGYLSENSWSETQTLKHTLAWFGGKMHLQLDRTVKEGAACVTAVGH